jgi:undecaprenyl diphosphate synthase
MERNIHVAIIMDGNGRWAIAQNKERLFGHKEGAKTVKKITTYARKTGIKALTLYAFSQQNWSRPSDEVAGLMELLGEYIVSERDEILDNNIRFSTIGDISKLSKPLRSSIDELTKVSSSNSGMDFCIALSYGSREEILLATKRIAEKCSKGDLSPDDITEELFASNLYTSNLPPLDLIIRTSGEKRLSNFLMWQAAYAEFYFTNIPWPDFNENEFQKAIDTFNKRERRFGLTGAQIKEN